MGVAIKLDGYDELMAELNRIDDTLSGKLVRDMVKAAGEVVAAEAKRLCPRGDPADSPDLKPLNETIAVELRDYGVRQLAVVGPQYPAGAHGHLVENGHEVISHGKRTGTRTEPKPFVRPAFDAEKSNAERIIAVELRNGIEQVGKEK